MRGSFNHNTLAIDGRPQSTPAGAFHWRTSATARLIDSRHVGGFDWAEAVHDGYAPLEHRRTIVRADGAGWLQSLWRIILPLMVPGLTVVFVFTFVLQWGNFFVPFILLQAPESQPASVTIYTFFSQYGQVAYGQLAAFAILYTAPVVVLYSALSRVFSGAFSLTGAVKG